MSKEKTNPTAAHAPTINDTLSFFYLQLAASDYREFVDCYFVFVKVCDLFGFRFFDHELRV